MKKLFLLPVTAILGLLFFQGITLTVAEPEIVHLAMSPEMPSNVKAIVDQKFYGSQNADKKNEKGKAKLDWDALEAAKKSKGVQQWLAARAYVSAVSGTKA